MEENKKSEIFSSPKELALFLRELADAVEQNGNDEFACVADFKKLKLNVTNEFGQIAVKLKCKPAKSSAAECVAEQLGKDECPHCLPKYKDLKKRMKSSFKVLFTQSTSGKLPPDEAVESFLEDSALMVRYPGYGDEFYEEYSLLCDAYAKAFQAQNMEKLDETVKALAHMKNRCHAIHD